MAKDNTSPPLPLFFNQPFFFLFHSTEQVNDSMDKLKELSSKAEDLIDRVGQPLKPHIPLIARFLIVATFLEDTLRIFTQWSDQVQFMQDFRHFPKGLSHLFLGLNIITMMACSGLIIVKRYQEYAVYGLLGVVIAQGLGYGLIFNLSFFLRNLSVMGGLLMVLSDALPKGKQMFAALPQLSESNRRTYLQLAGRILLIFLFVGSAFHGEWSWMRVFVSVYGLVACVMVAVGFKAKWSAMFLVLFLSVFNIFINNFWSVTHTHLKRDFLKYDFFQTLSTVGGFLLLVSTGPGLYSVDEKKKAF
ncbi:SURF4 family-domain-containing protein [Radiomyces spectabilis]|uniref:SURF4 family-domain-containing protein n=1 Tax=Radiomyces spectabilis TaxID=64574 RepID=UPI00221F5EC0|nr:SURF4 family-domain-containing protein [Radiomyces spectabilis]KAI8376499.1 SURF4 family-domain-containing protein [Radiomyces spectabilis]